MLCVLAVFLPALFMTGVGRQLFVPLSLAVGFAMLASYFISSPLRAGISTWQMPPGPRRAAVLRDGSIVVPTPPGSAAARAMDPGGGVRRCSDRADCRPAAMGGNGDLPAHRVATGSTSIT